MSDMMDKVDQEQQKEINALQKKDVLHDRDLFWMKCVAILSIVVVAIIGVFFFQMNERSSPYGCPHKDCVHYTGARHQ